jgi:hypothetical protein
MKPAEVPLQAEPTPSRTCADARHAPCRRSRDPGHERVVTETNPCRPGLSPTIVAGSARTWPARPDSTCSERGCARARPDHLGQNRRPEAFCAASRDSLFLDDAYKAVGAIYHHFWRDGGSARSAQQFQSWRLREPRDGYRCPGSPTGRRGQWPFPARAATTPARHLRLSTSALPRGSLASPCTVGRASRSVTTPSALMGESKFGRGAVAAAPIRRRALSAWSRTWSGPRPRGTSGSPPGSGSPSCPGP